MSTNETELGDGFQEYSALKAQHNIRERMTLVDTPGYNPNSKESVKFWLDKILKQIKGRFEEQLLFLEKSAVLGDSESLVLGRGKTEGKIHLILHLIDGKDLTEENAVAINILGEFCPVIPILSKSDLLEFSEIAKWKDTIKRSARTLGIKWYDLTEVIEL